MWYLIWFLLWNAICLVLKIYGKVTAELCNKEIVDKYFEISAEL